jgi:hypothetical protein
MESFDLEGGREGGREIFVCGMVAVKAVGGCKIIQ